MSLGKGSDTWANNLSPDSRGSCVVLLHLGILAALLGSRRGRSGKRAQNPKSRRSSGKQLNKKGPVKNIHTVKDYSMFILAFFSLTFFFLNLFHWQGKHWGVMAQRDSSIHFLKEFQTEKRSRNAVWVISIWKSKPQRCNLIKAALWFPSHFCYWFWPGLVIDLDKSRARHKINAAFHHVFFSPLYAIDSTWYFSLWQVFIFSWLVQEICLKILFAFPVGNTVFSK